MEAVLLKKFEEPPKTSKTERLRAAWAFGTGLRKNRRPGLQSAKKIDCLRKNSGKNNIACPASRTAPQPRLECGNTSKPLSIKRPILPHKPCGAARYNPLCQRGSLLKNEGPNGARKIWRRKFTRNPRSFRHRKKASKKPMRGTRQLRPSAGIRHGRAMRTPILPPGKNARRASLPKGFRAAENRPVGSPGKPVEIASSGARKAFRNYLVAEKGLAHVAYGV